mgnify:CR=1 FL=1
MGKLDTFRKVMALPEVLNNVELTNKLKEAYTDYLELLEENNEIKTKLKELEEVNDIKKNAKIYSGFYTLDGVKDVNGEDICFCLNCLYEHKLQIPMAFGVVERGVMDLISGTTFVPNKYGLSCHKCGTKLAINKKEKNNG